MSVCVHVCIFTVNILMSYPHWSESYFFLADGADPKNMILHIQVLHCLLVSLYRCKTDVYIFAMHAVHVWLCILLILYDKKEMFIYNYSFIIYLFIFLISCNF